MSHMKLTRETEKEIEDSFVNDREAHELLALIDDEFRSDPMSVQCFDLRIVQRIKECCAKRKVFVRNHPLFE